jgi:hypothetical protein
MSAEATGWLDALHRAHPGCTAGEEVTKEHAMSEEQEVGKVVGYFARIGVAAVEATSEFAVGDTLHYKGHTSDFTAPVTSMQIEGAEVTRVGSGDQVGIKVPERVRAGDVVYRVTG